MIGMGLDLHDVFDLHQPKHFLLFKLQKKGFQVPNVFPKNSVNFSALQLTKEKFVK